jgi:hypothetical protein
MNLNENDMQHPEVTKILKSLQQAKTPHNFEADLMRKINSKEYETRENKESFWEKIFAPSKFLPSAGLAIAAVIILFVINLNSNHPDDPLTIQPRVREDVLVSDPFSTNLSLQNKIQEKVEENKADKKLNKPLQQNNNSKDRKSFKEGFAPSPNVASISAIDKKGLNFRQINLTFQQRQEINKLKQKMIEFIKNSK